MVREDSLTGAVTGCDEVAADATAGAGLEAVELVDGLPGGGDSG